MTSYRILVLFRYRWVFVGIAIMHISNIIAYAPTTSLYGQRSFSVAGVACWRRWPMFGA